MGGRPAPSHPGPCLPAGGRAATFSPKGPPGRDGEPGGWRSPPCARPAPQETARLISSLLSLPVPSGLAGGSGSNRSGGNRRRPRGSIPPGSAALPGPPRARARPPPTPARPQRSKGPPAPSEAPPPHPAAMLPVLTQRREAEGCSDPSSRRVVGERGGNSSDLPPPPKKNQLGQGEGRGIGQTPGHSPRCSFLTGEPRAGKPSPPSPPLPPAPAELGFGCWRT